VGYILIPLVERIVIRYLNIDGHPSRAQLVLRFRTAFDTGIFTTTGP
jgi:hypothetical protein